VDDKQTKTRANEKLVAMGYQIGFPKKWRTYSFKVDPRAYGTNAVAAMKASRTRQLAKIGKPVDKDDWDLSAATVNAFYNPQINTMVFPAGILQKPFYSVDAAIPVNLGAMGMVVGHELTHGFDDQGAQFDAVGNLTNWWQAETEQQFKSRTQCVTTSTVSTRWLAAAGQRREDRREHRRHRRRRSAHRVSPPAVGA
jgi:predicted metalloendopeptidase